MLTIQVAVAELAITRHLYAIGRLSSAGGHFMLLVGGVEGGRYYARHACGAVVGALARRAAVITGEARDVEGSVE